MTEFVIALDHDNDIHKYVSIAKEAENKSLDYLIGSPPMALAYNLLWSMYYSAFWDECYRRQMGGPSVNNAAHHYATIRSLLHTTDELFDIAGRLFKPQEKETQ